MPVGPVNRLVTQEISLDSFFISKLQLLDLIVQILRLDLDIFEHFLLHLKLLALLVEFFGFILQLFNNFLIIGNFAEKLPIYSLFVEILVH